MNAARTPLTRYAHWHQVESMRHLLRAGADPDEPDGFGYRAIDYLTFDKWYVLIEFGADVNKALRPFCYITGFREPYESGVSLSGAPSKSSKERHAVFCSVLYGVINKKEWSLHSYAAMHHLGMSLWGLQVLDIQKRRTVLELVLSIPNLSRGVALRVVEWALWC